MGKTWTDRKQFAREVKLHKTYYYVMDCKQPWGDEDVVMEIVFDHRQAFTGAAMSGSMSAERLVSGYGPVFEDKPRGLRVIGEAPEELHIPDPHLAAEKAGLIKRLIKR